MVRKFPNPETNNTGMQFDKYRYVVSYNILPSSKTLLDCCLSIEFTRVDFNVSVML